MTALPAIVARTEQLVRRPPAEVFGAFVDPEVITTFWLGSTSGALVVGETVHWSFLVEGAEVDTTVTTLADGERIAWDWSDGASVDVRFRPFDDNPGITHVVIEQVGFGDELEPGIAAAIDATQGFTLVLSSLKLLLETGSPGSLLRDKATLIAASLSS